MLSWLADFFTTLWAGLLSFGQAVIDWAVELGQGMLDFYSESEVWSLISEQYTNVSGYIDPFLTYAKDIDWFTGWFIGVNILLNCYAIAAVIRTMRTAKSFVPTMGD